jgi:hypothetical protein
MRRAILASEHFPQVCSPRHIAASFTVVQSVHLDSTTPFVHVIARSMASVTPRRSPRFQEQSTPSTTSTANGSSSTPMKMATRRSPFQPTSLEAFLLVTYPATLILGSLYSLIDPATRASPYSAASQSHVHEFAPSYFAQKSNLFNVIFVKRGWFWITISYFLFLFTHPSTGPSRQPALTPKRIQGIIRWGIVTVWWIFVTQWFFGPAIIDRGFTLTGGQCELVRDAEAGKVEMDGTRQFVTGIACKAVGGKWKGGHDISGHVFILVLGSMFLLEEVLSVLLRSSRSKEEGTILMSDGAVKSAEAEAQADDVAGSESQGQVNLGVKVVLGVAGLSIWMLLMTAAYFHTWFEKVSFIYIYLDVEQTVLIHILVHWVASSIQWYFRRLLSTTSYSKSAEGNRFAWCLEPRRDCVLCKYIRPL